MSRTHTFGSLPRPTLSLLFSLLIVLGVTLSGAPVGGSLSTEAAQGRGAAPEDSSGLEAAPKREPKRAKGKPNRERRDRELAGPKDHKQDGKEKDRERDGKKVAKQDRAKNGQHNRQRAQELTSGRLPAAESVTPSGGRLDTDNRYIVVLDAASGDALDAATDIAATTAGVVPTHVYRHLFPGFAAVIPDDKLDEVRRDRRVASVVPDEVVHGHAQTLPTGIRRIDADLDPTARIDGSDDRVDVDVAVLDTAGDGFHPDLNIWAFANCTDMGNLDDHGHGTHVGGTIGALDNGIGVVGVAPGARLWNIRVLRAIPGGGSGGMLSWVICGVDIVAQYATDQGDGLGDIEVANASLGGNGSDSTCGPGSFDAYHQAFCDAVAAGVTVVVSAGNDAINARTQIPAMYDEVITVSALADSDGRPAGSGPPTGNGPDDSLADFSNFGAVVDIAAPGVDIRSTVPTYACEFCDPSGYQDMSGTSMASPHVAGAAALYVATHPGAGPAQVKAALLASREAIALPGDPDGLHEGVLDLVSPPPPPPVVTPPPPSVESGAPAPSVESSAAPAKDKHKKKKKNKKRKKR